jgi:hypothetical protein
MAPHKTAQPMASHRPVLPRPPACRLPVALMAVVLPLAGFRLPVSPPGIIGFSARDAQARNGYFFETKSPARTPRPLHSMPENRSRSLSTWEPSQ